MARTDTFNNWATDVADSIREKTGKTDKIPANQFDTEIKNITTSEAPELQDKTIEITENGNQSVTADEGFDGLGNVDITVNVETPAPNLQDKSITITENGTLIITADEGFDGLNKVEIVINVANSSQEIIIDKQYVDTFVAGTIDGTRPPTYINSVNDNRAQYIGFNLKIIPGEEYTFVGGTSNFNFAVMQIGQDTVDNVLNGASFDAIAGILANTGWTSNNFTFTAVEGATNVWISAKKTSGSDFTTSDLKNLLPCYIEGPVYKG